MSGLSFGMPYLARTPSITSCGSSRFLSLKRIDGRGDEELPDGQSPGEGRRRKYGRIVLHDELLQKPPDLLFWVRQIDVAAPDPFVVRPFLHQDDRLGVVDEDDIGGGVHLLQVVPARLHEYLEILLADIDPSAVQGVVEFLRDLEELLPPLITSQRTSNPNSRSRGTIRVRISATPPPTAVELTFSIRLPFRCPAMSRRSSTTDSPTIGI